MPTYRFSDLMKNSQHMSHYASRTIRSGFFEIPVKLMELGDYALGGIDLLRRLPIPSVNYNRAVSERDVMSNIARPRSSSLSVPLCPADEIETKVPGCTI